MADKLQYIIEILKQGNGSAQAIQELNSLKQTSDAASVALAKAAAQQTGLTLAKQSLTGIGVAAAAATTQVAGLSVAFSALSTVMMALPTEKLGSLISTAGIAAVGRMALGFGGLAAAAAGTIGIGATAIRSGSALREEEASQTRLADQQQKLMLGLVTEIELRRRLGRLTTEQAKAIESQMLSEYYRTGDTVIRGQALSGTRRTLERESRWEGNPDITKRSEALQALRDLQQEVTVNSLEGSEREIAQAAVAKEKRVSQAREWALQAGLTAEEAYGYFRALEDEFQRFYKASRDKQAQEEEERSNTQALEALDAQMTAYAQRQQSLQESSDLMVRLNADALEGSERTKADALIAFDQRNREIEQRRELGLLTQSQYELAIRLSNRQLQNLQAELDLTDRLRQQEELRTFSQERMAQLERDLAEEAINSSRNREQQTEYEFQRRIALYQQLRDEGLMTEQELAAATQQATITRGEVGGLGTDMKRIGREGVQAFSSGLASAFVSFASGAKNAKQAFADFAAGFLQMIAQMILQAIIFRMVSSAIMAFGWGGGGGVSGGVDGSGAAANAQVGNIAAKGGHFPLIKAANGVAGVTELTQSTYFPQFGVLAGEAGREWMTVLANPQAFALGGFSGISGTVNGNRLAMMNRGDVDKVASGSGGSGGRIEVQVTLDPALRAQIINDSVENAVVRVGYELQHDGNMRASVRALSS